MSFSTLPYVIVNVYWFVCWCVVFGWQCLCNKAQPPRYFMHVPVQQGTTTQILHARACVTRHNHPDTSCTCLCNKAQPPRYFMHRHVQNSTTTLILHAQARAKWTTTLILYAQARAKWHNHTDTSCTGTCKMAQPHWYFKHRHGHPKKHINRYTNIHWQ
jgi:hypothetical protein